MPHRPERPTAAMATEVAGGAATAVYGTSIGTTNSLGGPAGRILRPAPQPSLHHTSMYNPAAGIVTPLANPILRSSQPWMPSLPTGIHRLASNLAAPKSSDSADRSTATKPHDEDTVATLATEGAHDEDEMEKREATASALLLVSSKAVSHETSGADNSDNIQPEGNDKESGSAEGSEASEPTTVPLKKRKKHLDFLRRNRDTESTSNELQSYHVSPVSHSSLGSSLVEGRTVSSEEHTPNRPGHAGAHRSNSYDSKESPYHQHQKESTQELPVSAKIHNAIDIAPPTTVVVPHFPSVLHQLLSDVNFAGHVVTWLPNGEAWKVLRWDALWREVLPLYFSDLRDEDGSGAGTIDAFLWHLTAWGFEEIKDGTDVGAYRHDVSPCTLRGVFSKIFDTETFLFRYFLRKALYSRSHKVMQQDEIYCYTSG